MDDDGMRDCARGKYCAARKTVLGEDGRHVVVPAQTYTDYCAADRDRIAACLGDFPRRYAELAARIGDRGRLEGQRVSGGGRTPPIPINVAVDTFQRQAVEVLVSWEERVRCSANLADVSGRRRDLEAVKVASDILVAHVDALLALPADAMRRTVDLTRAEHLPQDATGWVHPEGGWVEYNDDLGSIEAGLEILNLHHRYLRWLGYTPKHDDLIVACWECDERKLRRWDGSAGLADHVECLHCREEYLGDRLARLMVDELDARQRKANRERRTHEAAPAARAGIHGAGGRP